MGFGQFDLHRFKRLTPALALTVACTMLMSAVVLSPFGSLETASETAGYFDAPAVTNPLLNTLSLSAEEQFHLSFPALVAAVAALSFALLIAGESRTNLRGSSTILGFYSPFSRAWEYEVGPLLAIALGGLPPCSPLLASTFRLTGLTLLAASLWPFNGTAPFLEYWTLL
jgi:peptidoglycan/LPS O-acetylase OafA/YrhL